MIDHERIILAGILKKKENLLSCLDKIKSNYFSEKKCEIIYRIIINYYKKNKGLIKEDVFSDIVSGYKKFNQEMKNEINFLFDEVFVEEYPEDKFSYSIDKLIKEKQDAVFSNFFEKCVDEYNLGNTEKTREILVESLKEIQKYDVSMYQEGDILSPEETEKTWIKLEENRRKFQEEGKEAVTGILTGINAIDEVTLGILNSEVWVFSGWTGDGKTQLLKEIAYHAAVGQKKNVVVVTLEMKKVEWRSLIYTRHGHGIPEKIQPFYRDKGGTGLENRKIMFPHLLNDDEMKAYKRITDDLKGKWGKEYGRIYVYTPESRHTIDDIENKVLTIEEMFDVDLIVLDYLSILDPVRLRGSDSRNDKEKQWRDLKILAQTYNNKKGIPIVTAHQVKQVAWEKAKVSGRYILSDLADTVASSRNANLVGYVLRTDTDKSSKEMTIGVTKMRRGGEIEPFKAVELYERSLITNYSSKGDQND